ncbi:hypothetical protein B0T24DRAFT_668777, partial [Lasiosphaeria ovina]
MKRPSTTAWAAMIRFITLAYIQSNGLALAMGLTGCKMHSSGKCYPSWAAHSVDNSHSVENTATSRGTTVPTEPGPTSLVARQDLP